MSSYCMHVIIARDCGHLPPVNDVYTIINQTNHTTEGSVIEFQCLHTSYRTHDALNTTTNVTQAECLNSTMVSGLHVQVMCVVYTYDQETAGMGNGYPSSKSPCLYIAIYIFSPLVLTSLQS